MKIKRVLNIEDTILKHVAVARALKKCDVEVVDLAKTAEDGFLKIEEAIKAGNPYELLVTDMHFPAKGKDDIRAGVHVIEELARRGIQIPIVLCSSKRYRIDEVEACIFYNQRSRDIDSDIREALKKIEAKYS